MILVLAANKSDLLDLNPKSDDPNIKNPTQELLKQAQDYAKSIGALLFKTSAKSGTGVEDLFGWMGKQLLDSRLESERLAALKPTRTRQLNSRGQVQLDDRPKIAGGCCS